MSNVGYIGNVYGNIMQYGTCGVVTCAIDAGCGINACGAAGCGANACAADGCGAATCAVNACPVNGCVADACFTNFTPLPGPLGEKSTDF